MEGGDLRMSSIDERIVRVTFDNRQFEQGVAKTLASLDRLTKGLKLEGATKGLSDVTAASQKVDLKHLENSAQSIADKFTNMGRIATGALESIGARALQVGSTFVKSLSVAPIMDGFREYETNMNSIQTILANTAHAGTNLQQVTAALDELNHYSDQTIYNFSEMAKNIGTFTAAGVSLDTATNAIKGIANLAAVSGSNSQQASTAMYQLSQAISAGKVSLEDWNSVVNAGMGGKVFQDALMETARVHGVAVDDMVKKAGSFRLTLQEGWLTGEILTETLSKFTGDLTAAQLKTMGYNEQQIAGILKMAEVAKNAATEVKTMSQLINTLKEASGSGWAQTWQIIFGDFNEAKGLFTEISNVLGDMVKNSADSRNKLLTDWKEMGGRAVLIDSISTAFHALLDILKPIRDAFRQIFPATTAKQLYDLTVSLFEFTQKLKISSDTADKIKRTFAGLFAILDLGWEVVKGLFGLIVQLFSKMAGGSGDILKITANIGDFIVRLREAVARGDDLTRFFDKLGSILAIPIKLLQTLRSHLIGLFDGFDKNGTEAADSLINFSNELSPLGKFMDLIASSGDKLNQMFDRLLGKFGPLLTKTREFFSNFGKTVTDALESVFGTLDYGDALKGLNTGLLAAFVLSFRNIFAKNNGIAGLVEGATDALEALTNTLGAMQNTLRAATLLQIAIALGILTLSADKLSKVDSEGLKKALATMVGMLTELLASMAVMSKIGMTGFITMAAGMIVLALAISALTISVKALADMSWKELAKGLVGTTVLLAGLSSAVTTMSGSPVLISTALALVILAGAIKILVTAVSDLSEFSWAELSKGLVGVAALLASLGLFTRFANADKGGVLAGAGIVLLAAGIKILVSAVQDFSQMSWGEIGKGLAAIAGGLVLIGAALYLIPPSSVISAAGVLLVSASLLLIAEAVEKMGKLEWGAIGKGLATTGGALFLIGAALKLLPPSSLLSAAAILIVAASLQLIVIALQNMASMSWEEVATGLIVLAGALTVIAIAVNLMVGALAGAAAMLVVSVSLIVIAQALQLFAAMTWEEIAKGFIMLTGIFILFAAAGILLGPLVPILMGLGIAITLLGVGILAAGAGTLLFATALGALAVAGTAATAALIAMVAGLLGLIPLALEMVGKGLVAFAEVIATAGPAIIKALVTILGALIDAINTLGPKIIDALLRLILALLQKALEYVPRMVSAGIKLIAGLLQGIADNMPKVISSGANLIVSFLNGIAENMPKIVQAGINLIIDFVNSLAQGIRDNAAAMGEAGVNLATAIIEGIIRGLAAGLKKVVSEAINVVKSAYNAAKDFLGISSPSKEFHKLGEWSAEGMANGLDASANLAEKSAENLGAGAMNALKDSLSGLGNSVNGDLDTTYTITPILDLSNVEKNSNRLRNMTADQLISASVSRARARAAASGYQSNQTELANLASSDVQNGSGFTFVQNNSSPKALSSAEIYRLTKNQLSIAREALPT
jgi:tape measure domain-containing protein